MGLTRCYKTTVFLHLLNIINIQISSASLQLVFTLTSFSAVHCTFFIRSTPWSRPNKVGLKCPSVRPEKVSSISMKFGV